MHDMSLSEYDRKEMIASPVEKAEKYPHGLRLSLSSKELAKLGAGDKPQVDAMIDFKASAKVIEVRKKDMEDDRGEYCIELQIVGMELIKKEDEEKSAVDAIYGA